MDAKKIKLNSRGQSLIEFLLFVPFLLVLYGTMTSVGNAINGAINQQKITRAYFFYRIQNNSMIPAPTRSGSEPSAAWRVFSMAISGWASDFSGGNSPVAGCYKLRIPIKGKEGDKCESAYSGGSSQFLKPVTVFGICGATYEKQNGQPYLAPVSGNRPSGPKIVISNPASCGIQ